MAVDFSESANPQHSGFGMATNPQNSGFHQTKEWVLIAGRGSVHWVKSVPNFFARCALAAGLLLTSGIAMAQTASAPSIPEPLAGANAFGPVDATTKLTLTGVVKYVHLAPAQSRIQLLVTDAKGAVHEWSLLGPTQNFILQFGPRRRPLVQWDRVTFTINPNVGLATAGQITALTSANGVNLTAASSTQ